MWTFCQSAGVLEHNGKRVARGYSGARDLRMISSFDSGSERRRREFVTANTWTMITWIDPIPAPKLTLDSNQFIACALYGPAFGDDVCI